MSEAEMEHEGMTYQVFSCDKCKSGEVFYTQNKLLEHYTKEHSMPMAVEFKPSVGYENGVRE